MRAGKKINYPFLIIRGILLGVMAIAIGFAAGWILSGEKRSEKATMRECSVERQKAFNGVVRSVNRYEWNQHMNNEYFGINIKLNDTSSVNYMFEKEHHEELASFIKANDSIIKPSNSDSFIVVNDQGLARHFVLPACGEE